MIKKVGRGLGVLAAVVAVGGFTCAVAPAASADPPMHPCGYVSTSGAAYWNNCSIYNAYLKVEWATAAGTQYTNVCAPSQKQTVLGPGCCSGEVVQRATWIRNC